MSRNLLSGALGVKGDNVPLCGVGSPCHSPWLAYVCCVYIGCSLLLTHLVERGRSGPG